MTRRNRKPNGISPERIPFLPTEIKAMIVQLLSLDGDFVTMRHLYQADSVFSSLVRPQLYKTLSFHPWFSSYEDATMDELEAFVDFIAPASGQFVSHVSLSLMEESPNALNRWLLVYPRLPPLLPNISICHLSFDTQLSDMAAVQNFLSSAKVWQKMKHLSIRDVSCEEGGGQEPELALELASSFPSLQSLRLLGLADTVFPADYVLPRLTMRQLQMTGGSLDEICKKLAYTPPPLTHLVISSTWLEFSSLHPFLLAVAATLESFAIRPPTLVIHDPLIPDFGPGQFPVLRRLVIEINGPIQPTLKKFVNIPQLETLEVGSNQPDLAPWLVSQIRTSSSWKGLTEMGFKSYVVDPIDLTLLYEACDEAKITLIPGLSIEDDLPAAKYSVFR